MLVLILVYKKIDILFLTTKEIQHLRKRIEPCAWQCQLALTEREYPASHFKITQARLFNFSNPIKALLPCHPKTHCNGKKYISASLRKQSLKFTSDFSSPNERGNDSSTANRRADEELWRCHHRTASCSARASEMKLVSVRWTQEISPQQFILIVTEIYFKESYVSLRKRFGDFSLQTSMLYELFPYPSWEGKLCALPLKKKEPLHC